MKEIGTMREITIIQAQNEAIIEEMEKTATNFYYWWKM